MAGLPVTIRLLDPPLHEFLPSLLELSVEVEHQRASGIVDPQTLRRLGRVQELEEVNPMLGMRGCRLGIVWPEIYRMQVQAIISAALHGQGPDRRAAARRDHDPAGGLRRGASPDEGRSARGRRGGFRSSR